MTFDGGWVITKCVGDDRHGPQLGELVKGSELSYVEDLVGSFFKMTNPNAKSSCGCGTSFSI